MRTMSPNGWPWPALANLASGNSYLMGDANLDGVVDVSDFNAWNSNKFTSTRNGLAVISMPMGSVMFPTLTSGIQTSLGRPMAMDRLPCRCQQASAHVYWFRPAGNDEKASLTVRSTKPMALTAGTRGHSPLRTSRETRLPQGHHHAFRRLPGSTTNSEAGETDCPAALFSHRLAQFDCV